MVGLFTSTFTEFENKTFVNFLPTKLAQFEILSPKVVAEQMPLIF